jgi:uncharacterized membrane protein YozB (DUF420 family)
MLRAVSLDPKLIFWTAAFANMLAIVSVATVGVRRAQRREIAGHRRLMLIAAALVALFLLAYVAKVGMLGREQLEVWERRYVWTLRFHETCVAVMVLAGSRAVWLGAREGFRDAARARSHRRAGWTAVVSALLGVMSAGYVLIGMFERSE